MPLIKNGRVTDEDWAFLEDDAPIMDGKVSVSLKRFLEERETLLERNQEIGVRLEPADDPHDLKEDLDRLTLIEVSFPKYADGRGYSQAQLLRRRLGYEGELRAVGDVLRDQLLNMVRSGFDAVSVTNTDLNGFVSALGEYQYFYQPAADGVRSVFERRHSEDA
ncbi:MAG: DUF934 domain-containing protein [Pseudomonadota bacterium]